jgi:hypothetical protein
MAKYQIYYLISGTRCVEVTTPEGKELPENLQGMTLKECDELIYSMQESKVTEWEDIDYAEEHKIVRLE